MTIRRFVVPSLLGALFVASLAVGSGPLREPAGGPAQDPDHLTIRETPPPIDDPAPSAPSSEGAPSRLTPAGVRVLDASGLSGSLGALTDRDTRTALAVTGTASLAFDLEQPETISRIWLYGRPNVTVSVFYASGAKWVQVQGLQQVSASALAPDWNELVPTGAFATSSVRIDLAANPPTAGEPVPEIEIWSTGAVPLTPGSPRALALAPEDRLAPYLKSFAADPAETAVADEPAVVTFNVARPVSQIRRAYLVYELNGLESWLGVRRSINGSPAIGGILDTPSADWSLQVERINPDWLREGTNELTFGPADGSLPYSVRRVRLLAELDTGANAVETVAGDEGDDVDRAFHAAVDGDVATGWSPFPDGTAAGTQAALTLDLDRTIRPSRLGIDLRQPPSGSVEVQTVSEDGVTTVVGSRGASELRSGWNLIPLTPGAPSRRMRVIFQAGTGPWDILEVIPFGSGVGARSEPPRLGIVWPDQGQFAGREAYIRGFVTPADAGSGLPRITVAGTEVASQDGAFGVVVDKDAVGLADEPDDAPWAVEVQAVYPGGATLTRTVHLTRPIAAPHSIEGRLLGPRTFSVQPGQPRRIRHDEAALDIDADSLDRPKDLTVTPLREEDLPALDGGMTNVTKSPRRGYRFEPHGTRFKKNVRVTLPYDLAKLPAGMTEDDIHTFYFDDQAGRWVALDRVEVDTASKTVVSLTDHFTDMINGTLALPEHPQPLSYDPTAIEKVKPANPSDRIVMIEPPKASNTGDASTAYPLDLPAGRGETTPKLAVAYDSGGANGWLGLGWNLGSSAVSIDTRWGVPRYDAALETETYTIDGAQLTPVAHRAASVARTAEKVFHQRVEGKFARIVRHGSGPSEYWWEVTDKDGMVSVYGGDAGAVLTDDQGRIFRWFLRETRDPHGNGVRYEYARVDDAGVDGGTVPGRQLYLQTVNYTTFGGQPGAYTVRLIRDADLGEPRRSDVQIDARGGFKMVTSQLLRRVELTFSGTLVRSWDLEYARGAFEKTLLASITQRGADGTALATHRFSYYDEVRQNGAYVGFAPPQTWDTGSDDVRSAVVDDLASTFGSDAGRATGLSGYETTSAGGHLYAGFNPDAPTKQGSVGAKIGYNGTLSSDALLSLVDLNGDGLIDKVFKNSAGVFFRLNQSGPHGATVFGPPLRIDTLPAIARESTSTFSVGAESYVGATLIANKASSVTSADVYFADVNGDGLQDLVDGSTVLFNHPDPSGVPTFTTDAATSPVPVGPAVVDSAILPDFGPEQQEILAGSPLQDTIRRWVAPFPGQIRITGDVSLTPAPGGSTADDGVRVAIQHNGSELWSQTIDAGDNAPHAPSGVDAVAVQKGDRIYFRVGSRAEGSHDVVAWDPEIVYVGAPATTDVNGLDPWRARASEDFVFAGRPNVSVKLPFNGRVRLAGDFHKVGVTTDDVTLLVLKNGVQVYAHTLNWDETDDVPMGIGFDVAQNDTFQLRVKVDSPIDLKAIDWTPSLYYAAPPDGPAPTYTIDGNTVTVNRVTDDAGHPIIQLHPSYDIDFYPVDGLTSPQEAWVAPSDGTVTVSSHLTAAPDASGIVFMTAKKRGALLAKRTIFISNGVVVNKQVDIDVAEDDEIFFDYSCHDPELCEKVGHRVIKVDGDEVPSAFHAASFQGVFPQPYRGWAPVGYAANPPRDTQPIVESDLDQSFDENSTFDPRTSKVFLYTPFPEGNLWRGPEDETFVTAGGASSSRVGPNAATIPGTSGAPTAAPVRLSRSSQLAGEVGIGFLSGSASSGDGSSDVDYLDMNGDRFPDVVGNGRIQFSPPIGGLETASRAVGGLGAPRTSDGTAANGGVGGSPAHFTIGARGQVDTPGRGGSPKDNNTGSQMVALGLSGSLGSGSSSIPYDLTDMNGDGLPDRVSVSGGTIRVALNLGYGFADAEPWGQGTLNEGESASASIGANLGFNGGIYDYGGGASLSRNTSEVKAMLADVNGDGLPDRLSRSGNALHVGLNTGNGFLADVDWSGAPQGAFATSANTAAGGGAYFTVGIGPVCLLGCYVIINPGADVATSMARQETALLDVDGDGDVDHVTSTDDASLSVARNTTGRTNLLRSIARPMGGTIDIDYDRDGNTPDLPQSRWVMSRVSAFDGVPGDGVDRQVATFRYEKGVWDRLEREFYGFGRVVEEIRDAAHADALYRATVRDYRTDSFYSRGLLLRERLEDAAGRPFVETENSYELRDIATNAPLGDLKDTTATAFPALVRSDRRFYEGQAVPGKTTFTTQEFDALGNVVRSYDAGDAGPQDDVDATIEYSQCDATHIVGVPVKLVVKGNGAELRRREGVVDCATGEIVKSTEFLAGGTGAETLLEHDDVGNLTRLVGPPNANGQRYELRYEYDPVVRTYPTRTTDSFGYASTQSWDFSQGLKTGSTDVNGNAMSFVYDAFGRMTAMTGPYEQGTGKATIAFEYHPEAAVPWSRTRHIDTYRNPADPIDVVRFVDGLGRDLQSKSDAAVSTGSTASDVMVVSGRRLFDMVGRITDEWHPVVEPLGTPGTFNGTFDTVAPTHTDFDVLDRPTRITIPDGTSTAMRYGFGADRDGTQRFEQRITDAMGAVTFRYQDVRDLVTGDKQINRTGGGSQEIWTSYAYDALKRLVRMTDDHGNVTRVGYDNLNRKVLLDSPDEGRIEESFDLAGNRIARVTSNLRAEGRQISYDYEFIRLTGIRYPDVPENNVTYTYGAPGAPLNRAGRVVTIADGSGSRERSYGKLGEIVAEVRTVATTTGSGPEVYRTEYTYDTFGRIQSLLYPDGEALTFSYDSGGRARNVVGRKAGIAYDYVRRLEYDKFGDRAVLEAGNGTRTTFEHRPDNRRLSRVTASKPDGTAFLNVSYAYDDVGNVLSIVNAVPVPHGSEFGGPTQQTFTYDDLERLTSSRGTFEFAPNKTNRYTVSFDYDTINNLTSRSQYHEIVQPSGSAVRQSKTSYAWTYAYAGPHPHGATHVGDRTLSYDANGNQSGWDNDLNGTRRTIVWDEENRMRSLADNGHTIRYAYDDTGERVIKRGPQGETAYVNPWFTIRNRSIGTKHVWVGSMRIASKMMKQDRPGGNPSGNTPVEKDLYFYHQDHLGSTSFVTDASGALYEHLEYFPFGETWVEEAGNTQRTPYGFTGKELDEETGLYYVGARYHDPRIGSFNSGEPLLFGNPEKAREHPAFLSVYSYARQNPQRFVDPDGKDVIIAVGQNERGDKRIGTGFTDAAKAMQASLKAQGITAHIVFLPKAKDTATTPAAAIRATADTIVKGDGKTPGKVSGLVYIGHGEVTGMGLMPRADDPLSIKDAIDAARVEKGGAFVAWGCKVAIDQDAHALNKRGVHVYATMDWTYTRPGGDTAFGNEVRPTTKYKPLATQQMKELTQLPVTCNQAICEDPKNLLEDLKQAEDNTK